MGKGIRPKVLENLPDEIRYLAHIVESENPGFIYFLISDDLGLVKIGASNRWKGHQVAVDSRITEVKNDVPFITIDREYVILAGSLQKTESEIHDHFAAYHVAGEWYIYSDDLKLFVDEVGELLAQLDKWSETGEDRPTLTPWNTLKSIPKPPSKKFKGVRAIFDAV